LMKLFPANIRYSALSLSFNICFGIFGGIVPSLSIFLIEKTESTLMPGVYLMIAAMVTFYALSFFRESNDE